MLATGLAILKLHHQATDSQFRNLSEMLSKYLTIFSYSNEAEDVIKDLLDGLLEQADLKLSVNSILNNILNGVMKCTSVDEIIEEIIKNLPIAVDDVQRSLINISAEKLYKIHEYGVRLNTFTHFKWDALVTILYTIVPIILKVVNVTL